jgi:hypothetical protein
MVRVATWVFAAVGIKALYDRFWPKAKEKAATLAKPGDHEGLRVGQWVATSE